MGVKGILLIVAGLMFLVGFIVVYSAVKRKQRCTEPAVATIVDIKRKEDTDDKGNKSYSYRPVLEYKVGIDTYKRAARVSSSDRKAYKVGTMVNIKFNPLKPKEFMTAKQKNGYASGILLMVVAAALAIAVIIIA
jgi:hypothetical protein